MAKYTYGIPLNSSADLSARIKFDTFTDEVDTLGVSVVVEIAASLTHCR